ncbi:hypothetical protein ACFVIY_33290 [Streptomyces sp. NPDC127166]|uniref:hypothetical protein n=1 Tax=Streptomyces sp. NPDC127166 TaxID=3345380 RepID=UPI003639A0F8
MLTNGERLTPSVVERPRMEMPLPAGMATFHENDQLAGRGLDGAPEDGVMPLPAAPAPEPMPALDEKALADAQAATAVLVRQGKASEPVGAMVIPARRGVLFAVGGRDGEPYVNGRALTRQRADDLRAEVPDLAPDVDRLQAMRAERMTVVTWAAAGGSIRSTRICHSSSARTCSSWRSSCRITSTRCETSLTRSVLVHSCQPVRSRSSLSSPRSRSVTSPPRRRTGGKRSTTPSRPGSRPTAQPLPLP